MTQRKDEGPAQEARADGGTPVRDVVDRLLTLKDHEEVALRDLIGATGHSSFVPALTVPALLVLSPLSGIPLFSTVCGILIVLIAAQMLAKSDHLWLPAFLMRRTMSGARLGAALDRLRKVAGFVDRHTRVRFAAVVGHGARILPQILCIICGAAMPLLEIVPFSSSILGAAVLCFAVSFLARDGLFVLLGVGFMIGAGVLPFFVLNTVTG